MQQYRHARDELVEAIDGLTDEQLTEKSLDGWSVKDHLAHLALWDDVRSSEVARISTGHTSAWRMTEEQDLAYNAVGYARRLNLSVDQIKWELAASRQNLVYAIESATPRGLDASLYGSSDLVSSHEQEHSGWIKRWRAEKASNPTLTRFEPTIAVGPARTGPAACDPRSTGPIVLSGAPPRTE